MTESERGVVSGQGSCHEALKRCFLKVIFKKNDSKLPDKKYLYLIVGHHWEILNLIAGLEP